MKQQWKGLTEQHTQVKWGWERLFSLVPLPLLHSLYTQEEILKDEARTRTMTLICHKSSRLGPAFSSAYQWRKGRSSESMSSASFSEGEKQLCSLWRGMKCGWYHICGGKSSRVDFCFSSAGSTLHALLSRCGECLLIYSWSEESMNDSKYCLLPKRFMGWA